MNENIKDRINKIRAHYKLGMNKFEDKCGLSSGYISNLKSDIGTTKLLKIINTFPEISINWLLTGEGEMLTAGRTIDQPETEKLYPHLPVDVAAGFTDDILQGITPYMCNMLPRIPDIPRYDLTISVRGDSMEPTFVSGDRLAVRRCSDIIEWGAPHVLDTEEGVYLKRIRDDGSSVVCTSDNPDYPEFNIPKSSIRGLYRVIAVLRVC